MNLAREDHHESRLMNLTFEVALEDREPHVWGCCTSCAGVMDLMRGAHEPHARGARTPREGIMNPESRA